MIHLELVDRRCGLRWLLIALALCQILSGTAHADAIRLRSGDVLTGVIVERTDAFVVLVHPDLGEMSIAMEAISGLGPTPLEPLHAGEATDSAQTQPATAAPTDAEAESTAPASDPDEGRWISSLVLGGSVTNNDEGLKGAVNVRGSVNRRTPELLTQFSLSYLYKRTDGVATDNQFTGIANQQWLRPDSRWFYYVTGRYDYDEFRSWEQRVQAHGGPGFDFVQTDDLRLYGLAGLGARKDFGSIESPAEFEGQLGGGIEWTINPRQRLSWAVNWYPELSGADQRTSTLLDWTYLLDAEAQLSFNIHVDYEYSTDPDPGFPRDNYTLTWGLQLDF